MHNHYVDRGIIKWAPFDALVGYGAMIGELKRRLHKSEKPLLSDDQYEELNQKMNLSMVHNLDIVISYYHDGYIRHSFGKVKRLDMISKTLIMTHAEKIPLYDILEIDFS